MRVIGVVDLRGGRAVHAVAGRRDAYRPVGAVAGAAIAVGDPLALARAYCERLGIGELYVADLDALGGRPPQDALTASLAALGVPVLLDAGIRSPSDARRALDLGAHDVIVALETLPDFDALAAVCAAVGGRRVAFSLDVRNGEPVVAGGCDAAGEPPPAIAARARAAGAATLIVIDLARVGTGGGLDLPLIARVREAVADMTLVAGGGVRGVDDLARLADTGCDGALVATALHDGRIRAADVHTVRRHILSR